MCLPGKGITLVALVITIIILLILAGITINLTVGQSGILARVQQARQNYIRAEEEESKTLENLYSSMLVASNDNSTITVTIQELNQLINSKIKEGFQTGVVDVPEIEANNWITLTVNFSKPFENNNYVVSLMEYGTPEWWAFLRYTIIEKTETGFKIGVANQGQGTSTSFCFDWIAMSCNI